MKPRDTKVIVIGLDGATFDVLQPWMDSGKLPALASLARNGVCSRFRSTPNIHSASGWTSIITGRNPGKHGIYYFFERDFATGRMRYFVGGDRNGKAIWHYLNEAGKTVGFLNVPMTFPAPEVDGFAVSGLDAPELRSKGFTHPASLLDEVLAIRPDYTITPNTAELLRGENKNLAVDKWIAAIDARIEVAERLCQSHPADFFMVVFTASDWVQHKFWKFFDPAHPDYTEEGHRRFGSALLRVFQKLDEAVGRLLTLADDQTSVFIVSDHGFGVRHAAKHFLPGWLAAQGLLHYTADVSAIAKQTAVAGSWGGLMGRAQQVFNGALRRVAPSLSNKIAAPSRKESLFSAIDWDRTRAYAEFDNLHSIWINLRGRNANGIVQAGGEYESLRDEIIARLLAWRDAEGNPVVERAFKREEMYSGPFVQRAPDIQIWWADGAMHGVPINATTVPTLVKEEAWSGNHRLEGILMMQGPRFRKGVWASATSVCDLVPTVLKLFDLSIPAEIDGKVVAEAFERLEETAPYASERAAQQTSTAGEEISLSESDEDAIRERLEGLGYM